MLTVLQGFKHGLSVCLSVGLSVSVAVGLGVAVFVSVSSYLFACLSVCLQSVLQPYLGAITLDLDQTSRNLFSPVSLSFLYSSERPQKQS